MIQKTRISFNRRSICKLLSIHGNRTLKKFFAQNKFVINVRLYFTIKILSDIIPIFHTYFDISFEMEMQSKK